MNIQKNRENMMNYLLCWLEDYAEQEAEKGRLEALAYGDLEREFDEVYNEAQGIVPRYDGEDETWDCEHIPC